MFVCGKVKQMFERKRGYEGETGVFTHENEVDDFVHDEEPVIVFVCEVETGIFVCENVTDVWLCEKDLFMCESEMFFLVMKMRQMFVCVKEESVLLLSTFCFGSMMIWFKHNAII